MQWKEEIPSITCRPVSSVDPKQESPLLIEITVELRVIKKIGECGGRTVIFLLRPNLFFGPLSLF
jgi:hypothetical protein